MSPERPTTAAARVAPSEAGRPIGQSISHPISHPIGQPIATVPAAARSPLAVALDAALPQTQCRRCGYDDCQAYAAAIAGGEAINRCPPGGEEGIRRLAALTGRPPLPLDPACGHEGPRAVFRIDEAACIGCTLCIKACPVDCILGASRRMHTILEADCTGCALCVPACPVDCIAEIPVTAPRTGWAAWSAEQAEDARARYDATRARRARLQREHDARQAAHAEAKLADLAAASRLSDDAALARKRSLVEAALARARARTTGGPKDGPGDGSDSVKPDGPDRAR